MANDELNFGEELEKLLDAHDYALPQVGDIRKGIIVAINQQGVIIDLGLKRDGVVLPSDLAKLNQSDRDALQVNDEIAVYVMSTDEADSLTVSIHLAQMNQDWIDAEELMKSGEIIEGEVIGYNKGGAIVPYGRLRGFIPASHLVDLTPGMSDRKRQQRLAKLRGQSLPLKVIEVDRRRRRLVFSQRDAQREWDEKRREVLLATLKEGDAITGTVSGLRDFGIFVDLGGADGLVHISELAWHRVDHPREVVKVGDEIEVKILKLDREEQRISLSRKALLQNPWDTVDVRYEVNQLVEGRITRIVDYGAFAEIEPGIEGLLHLSQLSRGTVDKASDVVQEKEKHLLRIVSIDPERQRIGLSLRAVTANEQIEWMAQRELQPAPDVAQESDSSEEEAADTGTAAEATAADEAAASTEAAVASAIETTEATAVTEATEADVTEEAATGIVAEDPSSVEETAVSTADTAPAMETTEIVEAEAAEETEETESSEEATPSDEETTEDNLAETESLAEADNVEADNVEADNVEADNVENAEEETVTELSTEEEDTSTKVDSE